MVLAVNFGIKVALLQIYWNGRNKLEFIIRRLKKDGLWNGWRDDGAAQEGWRDSKEEKIAKGQ